MKRYLSIILAAVLLCGCVAGQPVATEPGQSAVPSTEATTLPANDPTTEPTVAPTTAPATEPTVEPTTEATAVPTESQTRSILDFLRIAAQPVGSTMYVWGGGWNEEDTGAGEDAVTLGVSPRWAEFAAQQDESYDFRQTRYQIHDGLDCSGYVGWAVYNVMETENGRPGYVYSSTQLALRLSERGLGQYIPADQITAWQPGDVMSMEGHCWIVVGMCEDGSVLMLHSDVPGVRFCGTNLPDGTKSQAVALAETIMAQYYPQWYARYKNYACKASYLEGSSAMRWYSNVLSDEENLRAMSAEAVVSAIFGQ